MLSANSQWIVVTTFVDTIFAFKMSLRSNLIAIDLIQKMHVVCSFSRFSSYLPVFQPMASIIHNTKTNFLICCHIYYWSIQMCFKFQTGICRLPLYRSHFNVEEGGQMWIVGLCFIESEETKLPPPAITVYVTSWTFVIKIPSQYPTSFWKIDVNSDHHRPLAHLVQPQNLLQFSWSHSYLDCMATSKKKLHIFYLN